MLTIWGRLNSHNVKKVAWFAEELGLSYVRHDIGGQFGMSDAYLAMNPNALIPTIDDDGYCNIVGRIKDMASSCGNRTQSCVISPRATAACAGGPTNRNCARSATAGWSGRTAMRTRSSMRS